MSAYIKTLKNSDGDIIYPQTKTSAVYTNDGHNIEEFFGKADAVKLQGVDTSGYEKFWRGTKAQYDALETKSEEILYIITDDKYALDSYISENYSSANTYEIRDICLYNNKLYRCTTAITSPEAWNAAHWTETIVGAELEAAYTELAGKATTAALTAHTGNKSNPHGVTPAQIGAAITLTLTVNVPTGWTASGGYYYKQVSVAGMLATDNPVADILPGSDNAANKLYAEAWGKVQSIDTLAGAVKIWCTEAPTTAFPVQFKVVR